MRKIYSLILFLFFSILTYAQQPAFPGAEGAGMYTTGGRGGNVYFVTSLADTETGNSSTHEGTLRWCLKQSGPRTIIFKVAGIIELTKQMKVPSNTTIAGQTAPGDGILIKNAPVTVPSSCISSVKTLSCGSFVQDGNNVIIRYIRVRPGDEINNAVGAPLSNIKFETDAIFGRNRSNIIIDHCSFGWGIDETASFYSNINFTMQYCLVAESLRASFHPKGSHGYGGIWGGQGASFHHNLLAHHDSRNPRMCGSRYSNEPDKELVDFRNNVVYNWGSNSGYAGEGGSYNFVNNYYSYGAATSSSIRDRIFSPNADDGKNAQPKGVWGTFYVDGNYTRGFNTTTNNNWNGIDPNTGNAALPGGSKDGIKSTTEFNVANVTTQSAEDAYELVLKYVGANNHRDTIDRRVINEVRNHLAPMRASKGTSKAGLIDTPSDVGGYPQYTYNASDVLADSDRDGMPDVWEDANGLNKNNASDRNTVNSDGYTMLEVYLNSLITNSESSSVHEKIADEKVGFDLYPNPATSYITINMPSNSSYINYTIFDYTGRTMMQGKLTQSDSNVINIESLSRGVYIITLSDGVHFIPNRFIKK